LNATPFLYSAALKANMPIFEAAPHFIERFGAGKASRAGLWCETIAENSQHRFAV
jgi:hypothetical protein